MTIEGCSFNDDEIHRYSIESLNHVSWNYHQMTHTAGGSLSHLVKGYQKEGWNGITNPIKPMGTKGEVKVEVSWGDKDGPKFTGTGSVSANDDKGNYVEVSVSQDSDGNGKVDVTAGHEKEDNNK